MSRSDPFYMAKALRLAEKGLYTTDPNPRVGCVLVDNDKIVAEGWHISAGSAHAEINALKQIACAKGLTAYVTLEPCSHRGKTSPCCDALIAAGVGRVVIAMQDPNPLVAGSGIKRMQQAGIEVVCDVLRQDAEALNKGFIKRMETGIPYIRSKLAMSLDGRTAMASGESKWITSEHSRADVQILRAESSAILTGINTVLLDDPSLNVRLDVQVKQAVRVILDSQLQIPLTAKLLSLPGQTWILTCNDNPQKIAQLKSMEVQVFQLASKMGRLDLKAVMTFLGQQQINTVMVEAGATLNGALLNENLIDEWWVYMAPCILGDQGRGLFHLPDMEKMADKKQLKISAFRQIGTDLRMIFNTSN
ncbi:MAG: bifunctional diaminohydroxyphosphoribosylaminopyrimidine deaminase/5-amino-6-(5-phosphoribosylamino)uracil reductase RibD [Methylococcales symbiont of Iophon sp. n. MRB-2018]|nr:MAG: bifunctional diaminohydroxyphosphoribosylaminopyrimidine deaminase/5-amino-6-(5-phosphoribosylamino)uracil reductase RibD [Methylococcales symbiont of Iophon sp. n. MRB-2018]KAF3979162.1 MAG: bifunctional diaminohydroxyphosphoribosylaminopyrimidine deaminase/5-amino-6-(5-phosphoribosylamino)uracil reductase RibD [Methylococcales symbiont of Iophon sp. n. MRB-2018]